MRSNDKRLTVIGIIVLGIFLVLGAIIGFLLAKLI